MSTFWIIVCFCIIALLFVEPVGYLFIKRTETIFVRDSYRMQYHSGDSVTRMFIVEDEDENIYLSEYEISKGTRVEITYKGFDFPKLGLLRRIVDFKYLN